MTAVTESQGVSSARDRVFIDRSFAAVCAAAAALAAGSFLSIIMLVAWKGGTAMSVSFLTQPMREAGLSGGIAHQLTGSLILLGTTLGIVLPLSLGIAVVRTAYLNGPNKKLATVILHTLNGIPSIIFGIFGFFVFVKGLGWGKSWLTGGVLLAFMILPTTALTLADGMARVGRSYIEQARALGLSRPQLVRAVLVPQSLSSFMSGVLLGLARAVGETAPIMFTATVFAGASRPAGVVDSPVLSLPYHIFTLAQEAYHPAALQNAWGAALTLILLAMILSLCALPFRLRLHEEAS